MTQELSDDMLFFASNEQTGGSLAFDFSQEDYSDLPLPELEPVDSDLRTESSHRFVDQLVPISTLLHN